MPKSIVFTTHPESHLSARYDGLETSVLPYKERYRLVAEHDRLYHSLKIDISSESLDKYKKPYLHWLHAFIRKTERIAERSFSWEFAYYIYADRGDEDSESACRWSHPLWFATIRNHQNEIIHSRWEIAFDDECEVESRRIATETTEEIRYYLINNAEARILNVVREYARLHPKNKTK